jgi:hypothetical protein
VSLEATIARWLSHPGDLGALPGDDAVLAQTPVLRHLAAALPGSAHTAVDLLHKRAPAFTDAPDPFPLFRAERAVHASLKVPTSSSDLRILTLNVALLDRTYLMTRVRMPEYPRRRAMMWETLLTDDWDVLLLQEVWEDADIAELTAAGQRYGYRVWGGTTANHHRHGLAIAVRSSRFREAGDTRGEGLFQTRHRLEQSPGPDVWRGWISWRLLLAETGLPVHLLTTHMAPFAAFWPFRRAQARELGSRIRSLPADDVVVLGGDTNAGPWYQDDTWTQHGGRVVANIWADTASYALLRHYGELQDAAVLGGLGLAPDEGITATDANSLHARSYLGEEPPARMDLLLMRGDVARVTRAEVVYRQRVDHGPAGHFELSDHYGVGISLALPA